MQDDKEHIVTCADCRRFYKEMISEDREALKEDFRNIVKEEWQCSLTTLSRVEKLEIKTHWLALGLLTESLVIITIILYIAAK